MVMASNQEQLDQTRLLGQGVEDGAGIGQKVGWCVKFLEFPLLQDQNPDTAAYWYNAV